MKNHLLLVLLFISITLSFAQSSNPHLTNQVVLNFSDDSNQSERQNIIDQMGTLLQGVTTLPNGSTAIEQVVLILVGGYPVEVDGNVYWNEIDLISTMQSQVAKVDNADLNYVLSSDQYYFSDFLGSANLAQYSPISADCESDYPGGPLEGGTELITGNIKVAILDTGLDPYYPTINQYVAGEVNVLTDDINPEAGIMISYGYNPYAPIAADENGHGTAVAGIIAGLSDRAGLSSSNLELFIIKCFDADGNATMYNLIQAVRVTNLLEIDLMNLSWSYRPNPQDEYASVLEYALKLFSNEDHGIIVAGSGNDFVDLDIDPYAPASLANINNLITVGGVVGEDRDCNGSLASFSNYGDPVEIAAPSASISAPGLDGYWALNASGTSFATPIVTAAVIQSWLAHYDALPNSSLFAGTHPIVNIITSTATPVPNLDYFGIEGAVNFEAACHTSGVLSLQSNTSQDELHEAGAALINREALARYEEAFAVMPNPFSRQLSVSFEEVADTPLRMELLTLQGRSIAVQQIDKPLSGNMNIEVPIGLPAGPYLLRIDQNGEVFTRIVIKD